MNDLVSAIITTHNREKLLLKAIESVLNQTYKNIECIVVDDASNHNTREVLCDLINENKIKYIYIKPEESRGGNYARNLGARAAGGKYLAFLDDDDEWLNTKIEKQVEVLEKSDVAKFSFCGTIREYDMDISTHKPQDIMNKKYRDGDLSRDVLIHIITMTSTIMIEKALFTEIGEFDETLKCWQEYEMCIRALQKTEAICVRENLVLYRVIGSDSGRISNKVKGWEETVRVISEKHKSLFETLTPDEKNWRLVYIYIDGFNRARQAKSIKHMIKYAWNAFKNSETRRIVIQKYLNRSK